MRALALAVLFAPFSASAQLGTPSDLQALSSELDAKLADSNLDKASRGFVEYKRDFRLRLDKARSSSAEEGLYAQILARLGPEEALESRAFLQGRLKNAPDNPELRMSLGRVAYEQKDYALASAEAKSIMDSPDASPELRERASALWHMTKGRGAPAANEQVRMSAKNLPVVRGSADPSSIILAQPPKRAGATSVAPGLAGAPDPTWAQTSAARAMLQKSKLGNEVLAFALGEGVKIELADMPANIAAQYDRSRKVISVPKNVASMDPVDVAVSIGHEAFHSRQDIRDGMIPSVESEQDATFAGLVIYHELQQAGEKPLPSGHFTEREYQRWKPMVQQLNLTAFNRHVKEKYEAQREPALQVFTENFPKPVRPVLRGLLLTVDADGLKDYETLDYQKGKWWNLMERDSIESTRQQHIREQAWQLKWMKEHRYEF